MNYLHGSSLPGHLGDSPYEFPAGDTPFLIDWDGLLASSLICDLAIDRDRDGLVASHELHLHDMHHNLHQLWAIEAKISQDENH